MSSDDPTPSIPQPEPVPVPTPEAEHVSPPEPPAVPVPDASSGHPEGETPPGASTEAPDTPVAAVDADAAVSAEPVEKAAESAPARPAQPVPQVPPAPQSHDLSRLAQDLQIRKGQVEAVVQLQDESNSVPFIARFRKDRTGGLDEFQVRRIRDRVVHLRELASRKYTILRSIANQGRLTDELTEAILAAEHPRRLDDLYLPFKPKKKSIAADAREKGLEPLALAIWHKDPAVQNLDEVLPSMVDPWKQLHDVNDVQNGIKNILAELMAELADVRGPIRAFLWDTAQLVSTKVETVPEGKGQEYRDYFAFKEPVRVMPPHRVLAVNRGERENIVRIRLDSDTARVREIMLSHLPFADHPHREFLLGIVDDSISKVLMPSLEKEIRKELTETAQDHAVDIFARNLRSLLMRRPLGRVRVLAIDPGIRNGCRVVVLDESGQPLDDATINPHQSQKRGSDSKPRIEYLIRKYQTPIVAIGSGTACREAEQLIADLIAEFEQRRVNPTQSVSSVESIVTSTAMSEAPATTAVESTSDHIQTEIVPSHTVDSSSSSTPVLSGSAETTMVLPGMGTSETSLISSSDPASGTPADSSIVQSPSLSTEAPAPAVPPAPPISMEGLAEPPVDLAYVIVNEAGASDYASSPASKEEFPNLDAAARSAISIGRRLQDPLAELVKIDPQHIGVGLYQHDVRAKYLRESVEAVIESCVNAVGIDVNTASVPLLRNVSGFNQMVARDLVEHRRQHGAFASRESLKAIPSLNEHRFTQSAGFVRVRDGAESLDLTWVHPECYSIVTQILTDLGFASSDLVDADRLSQIREKLHSVNLEEASTRFEVSPPAVRDLLEAIARPGQDPRDERPAPILRQAVLKLEDLQAGMELKGEVLNVVDFGAFVDVGLKDSGLVHISQMANRYIKSPYDVIAVGDVVTVWVMSVDSERRRVSLSMIQPGQERRAHPPGRQFPDRPQRGERQPHMDRPPQHSGPPRGERPPHPQRPQGQQQPGGPPRQFGPRPGGPGPGGKPRGPGAPGWRSGPKAAPNAAQPANQQGPASPPGSTPPTVIPPGQGAKKPPRSKPVAKLSDTQKTGKEPVYSFAQLAALLKNKGEPPAPPAEAQPPAAPPVVPPEEPKSDAPPSTP